PGGRVELTDVCNWRRRLQRVGSFLACTDSGTQAKIHCFPRQRSSRQSCLRKKEHNCHARFAGRRCRTDRCGPVAAPLSRSTGHGQAQNQRLTTTDSKTWLSEGLSKNCRLLSPYIWPTKRWFPQNHISGPGCLRKAVDFHCLKTQLKKMLKN